ncbi:MAG TPA: FAD-binding protein [Microlunatus sp.]|nr:FAD-binding protein [Microlunatus sp.]
MTTTPVHPTPADPNPPQSQPGPASGPARFNRRVALAMGAGALAVAASPQLVTAETRSSTPVDILIVGSGYAGSVAALRCAEAGLSTVVLERGRRWTLTPDQNTFATLGQIDGRAAWLSTVYPFGGAQIAKYTGVLEAFVGRGVVCLAGAGVGGGSLVNNTVMMEPRADLFAASFGGVLDHGEMADVWYPRARSLLKPSPIPDDVLASPAYANAAEFIAEARRAGLPVQKPDMAVDWDVVRGEIAGRLRPAAIAGASILGINSGAKLSVDRTVLAAAEATGLTSVLPLHLVTSIEPSADRYLVTAQQIDTGGSVVTTKTFAARKVLLAAGSVATTRLLVTMRAQGKLPDLTDAVGRGWGSGGDHIVLRSGYPLPSRAQGGPANAVITAWDNTPSPVTLLNFPLGLPAVAGLIREMLAVGSPPPIGTITYTGGTAVLNWPATDPRLLPITQAAQAVADKLDAVGPLISVNAVTSVLTSHSLGGAVLGRATTAGGELINYPGLYVIDSALIPGSTGSVPPALTVTALADRIVSRALPDLS